MGLIQIARLPLQIESMDMLRVLLFILEIGRIYGIEKIVVDPIIPGGKKVEDLFYQDMVIAPLEILLGLVVQKYWQYGDTRLE